MTATDPTDHPADPHYRELVETSVRLRSALNRLAGVLDLHAMGSVGDGGQPVCDECYEATWPCDTVLVAASPEQIEQFHAKAAERVATEKARAARVNEVRNRIHSEQGMVVETVTDVEDVRTAIGRAVKIGDTVVYRSPLTSSGYIVSRT